MSLPNQATTCVSVTADRRRLGYYGRMRLQGVCVMLDNTCWCRSLRHGQGPQNVLSTCFVDISLHMGQAGYHLHSMNRLIHVRGILPGIYRPMRVQCFSNRGRRKMVFGDLGDPGGSQLILWGGGVRMFCPRLCSQLVNIPALLHRKAGRVQLATKKPCVESWEYLALACQRRTSGPS